MRSGSFLLCEGLYATGAAGNPEEFFCSEFRSDYCRKWNLLVDANFTDYFRRVIGHGTSDNGVFSVKMHRHHANELAYGYSPHIGTDTFLRALFPNAKFVYLRRQNKRAQAISWYRAESSNEWWRIAGVDKSGSQPTQPAFNAARILRLEELLRQEDGAWQNFFAAFQIEPLKIEYENLARDYRNEVGRVLTFLDQDIQWAMKLPEPRLARQADAISEAWCKLLDDQVPIPSIPDPAVPAPLTVVQ